MVPMVCRWTATKFTASLDGECTFSLNSCSSLDYCFLWKAAKAEIPTAILDKTESTGSTLVVPVDVKGRNDQYECVRLKSFIKTHRIELLVYHSDEDNALVAKVEKFVDILRREGFQVALELSPVVESQSNVIAERKIQAVED